MERAQQCPQELAMSKMVSFLSSFPQMARTPLPAALPTALSSCPVTMSRSISTPAASAPVSQWCESQPRGFLFGGTEAPPTPLTTALP